MLVLLGCFILAFGWFGFNPGSTLGASANGNLRISSVAVNTMLAGMAGSFSAMYYMWIRYGKPDASMTGNGFLAGLVAITAPSGFVNPMASVDHRPHRRRARAASPCEFVERVLKLDDVVGAISVHGTNGIWGVISVGLFADGKSNYGGAWNGVPGSVTGLFYGDAGQLVAQLIGVATLVGFVFTFSFVAEHDHRSCLGPSRRRRRSSSKVWTFPEMGALGYPEFVLKPEPPDTGVSAMSTALVPNTTTRLVTQAPPSLPPVPWRDPHSVSPEDLAAYIQQLEQACLDNPQSADLRTCLGMAHAVNYDVYKSMDALEDARAVDPRTSGRS